MNHDVFELARRYGVRIEVADLGDWGADELRAEYDPEGPVIRINARELDKRNGCECRRFAAAATAHELYHHFEHTGRAPRAAGRSQSERAADTFARELLRLS